MTFAIVMMRYVQSIYARKDSQLTLNFDCFTEMAQMLQYMRDNSGNNTN